MLGLADVSFSMLVGPSAGAATWVGSIAHFVPGHYMCHKLEFVEFMFRQFQKG